MKKIFSIATALLAGLFVLTSCESDRDSNPTLTQPTTFVLNNPAVGEGLVALEKSEGIDLTWSQPTEYTTGNAPVVVTYAVQVGSKDSFSKAYSEAEDADNTGADYYQFDETTNSCNTTVSASDVATALQKLNSYSDEGDIDPADIYFRIYAAVRDGAANEYYPIYSNVVSIYALPYYVELQDAEPEMWCILGNGIGDGKWTNSEAGLGTSNFPMFLIDGSKYDKKTGQGEIEFTNWFEADKGFKILPRDNYSWCASGSAWSWDYGLCAGSEVGTAIYRNAGDDGGDIKVPSDGYYTIKINTSTQKVTIEPYDFGAGVTSFGEMSMIGFNDDWDTDIDMTPVGTLSDNHVWYGRISVESNTEFKFRANKSWDFNWGATSFPTGVGTSNGKNIQITAGTWDIMFNDLTGAYSCTAAKQ